MDVAATIAIKLRIGIVMSVDSLMSMTSLQPLSEYHSSKNKRVECKDSVSIAGDVLVGRVYFLIKSSQAFFAEPFVMR